MVQDRRGIKKGENLRSDSEVRNEATNIANGSSLAGGSLKSPDTKVVVSNEVLCHCKSTIPQEILPGMV